MTFPVRAKGPEDLELTAGPEDENNENNAAKMVLILNPERSQSE